jgi:hypothetical protein
MLFAAAAAAALACHHLRKLIFLLFISLQPPLFVIYTPEHFELPYKMSSTTVALFGHLLLPSPCFVFKSLIKNNNNNIQPFLLPFFSFFLHSFILHGPFSIFSLFLVLFFNGCG